jgi:PTH2 family peptidyl-tRNA hydrolase
MAFTTSASDYRTTIALILAGTIAGYFIGRVTNNTVLHTRTAESPREESSAKAANLSPPAAEARIPTPEPDSDSDDGEYADFQGYNEECKLVLVVRTDLGMTKGSHVFRLSLGLHF